MTTITLPEQFTPLHLSNTGVHEASARLNALMPEGVIAVSSLDKVLIERLGAAYVGSVTVRPHDPAYRFHAVNQTEIAAFHRDFELFRRHYLRRQPEPFQVVAQSGGRYRVVDTRTGEKVEGRFGAAGARKVAADHNQAWRIERATALGEQAIEA